MTTIFLGTSVVVVLNKLQGFAPQTLTEHSREMDLLLDHGVEAFIYRSSTPPQSLVITTHVQLQEVVPDYRWRHLAEALTLLRKGEVW